MFRSGPVHAPKAIAAPGRRELFLDAALFASLALLAVAGLIWSWGTWPDVLIDFGRELYVPWRLSAGDVLYRDVAYFNGPFSPCCNAAWFRIFGVGLRTLVWANFVVLLGVQALLYAMLKQCAGRAAAWLACASFLGLFAFVQLLGIANYNWICPYSHEMTHGAALSLGSIYLLQRYVRTRNLAFLAASGLLVGMVFLTKLEVFLAIAAAHAAIMGYLIAIDPDRASRRLTMALTWLASAVAGPLVALAILSGFMPMRSAAIGTLGGWAYVFDRVLTRNAFYQWSMGTDNLSLRLGHIVEGLGGYAVVIAGCVGVGAAMRTRVLRSRWAGGVLLCGFAGGAWLLRQHLPFQVLDDVAAPLQVLLLAVTLATAAALLRATRCADRSVRERLLLQLSLCIFALVLLLRILFHVRFNHYGFCLAAPASVVLIAAGHRFLARTVAALGGQPLVAQGLMTVLLGMVLLGHITISQWHFQQKQFHVGAGVDGFLADGRAAFLVPTMNFLAEHRTEDATLAVFPEGIMANYLLRMRNPTPYGLFIPMDVRIYGEPKMLASLRASPPMWILLVHRDDTEYGVRFFGRDYAHTIANWLQENYQIIGRAGAQPFCSDSFGILVGRRIDPLTTGPGSPNAP